MELEEIKEANRNRDRKKWEKVANGGFTVALVIVVALEFIIAGANFADGNHIEGILALVFGIGFGGLLIGKYADKASAAKFYKTMADSSLEALVEFRDELNDITESIPPEVSARAKAKAEISEIQNRLDLSVDDRHDLLVYSALDMVISEQFEEKPPRYIPTDEDIKNIKDKFKNMTSHDVTLEWVPAERSFKYNIDFNHKDEKPAKASNKKASKAKSTKKKETK